MNPTVCLQLFFDGAINIFQGVIKGQCLSVALKVSADPVHLRVFTLLGEKETRSL